VVIYQVGTDDTITEATKNLSDRLKSMFMCVSDIDWDSVSTIFLQDFELFRRRGILNCSDGVVFGTALQKF
jgi:hypothetical protein